MPDQQRIAEIRARATCGLESYRKKYPANWREAYIFDGDRDTLWLLSQLAAKDAEIERLTLAAKEVVFQWDNGYIEPYSPVVREAIERLRPLPAAPEKGEQP